MVFERLREAGLSLKGSKCQFGLSEVNYLGHVVTADGIKPDPAKVKAVKEFPTPKRLTDLRTFLGLTSYYRRFIKDYAKIASSIIALLSTVPF